MVKTFDIRNCTFFNRAVEPTPQLTEKSTHKNPDQAETPLLIFCCFPSSFRPCNVLLFSLCAFYCRTRLHFLSTFCLSHFSIDIAAASLLFSQAIRPFFYLISTPSLATDAIFLIFSLFIPCIFSALVRRRGAAEPKGGRAEERRVQRSDTVPIHRSPLHCSRLPSRTLFPTHPPLFYHYPTPHRSQRFLPPPRPFLLVPPPAPATNPARHRGEHRFAPVSQGVLARGRASFSSL